MATRFPIDRQHKTLDSPRDHRLEAHDGRRKSVLNAANEMLSARDEAGKLIQQSIQRESRWLALVPLLLLVATFLIDSLLQASLRNFLMAEAYYLVVGLV
ncbi:MAG: hypothetical protein Q7R22_000565 [Verrucomicrobiota bacterium JB025]|nr:hypothetical protein [Verrucomicrobiota bacterium JB025]